MCIRDRLTEADVCSNGLDEPYIWQRRWFQIMLASVVVFIVLRYVVPGAFNALYSVSSILVPVLVGLSLAYIVNPVLRFAGREAGVGRLAGTISIMLITLIVVALFAVTAVPLIVEQGKSLTETVQEIPPQITDLLDEYEIRRLEREQERLADEAEQSADTKPADPAADDTLPLPPVATAPVDAVVAEAGIEGDAATDTAAGETLDQAPDDDARVAKSSFMIRGLDWVMQNERARPLFESAVAHLKEVDGSSLTALAQKSLGFGVGLVGTAISFTSYLALATVIVLFCFFFFSWKFDAILAWFKPFIPAQSRAHTLSMLHKMDLAVSSFVRGRLIQSLIMSVVLCVGWWCADVPFWFLLGLVTGALNVVPFLPAVGAVIAIVLTVFSAVGQPDFAWSWGLLLWPAVVFIIAQTLDGYVVEPIVQGKATNLDPLTVMLAVLVGGSLASVLGMLLAIPLAACIKILMQELVLPKARAIAADN